jgi:solute carrier family 25 (mitochondrial folate transporter), member 32
MIATHDGADNAKYSGVIRSAGTVVGEEGPKGLYKGLGTTLFRALPATVVSMFFYELVVRSFSSLECEV